MSDQNQPSFFGGLPPRGRAAIADRPSVSISKPVRPVARKPLNTLSAIAFVVSFFVSVAGIVLAALALRQLRERDERGRGFALGALLVGGIGIAVSIALFAVFLGGGASVVPSITGVSKPTATVNSLPAAPHISKQEAAKAKAAVATGGGAVPGHIVSGDLCKALGTFTTTSAGKSVVSNVTPAVLASMDALAAVKSPNQIVYAKAAELAKDPSSVTSIVKAQAIVADFTKAVQIDTTTCP